MKDKLSLMENESRQEEQEGGEIRLEKVRLAAALFDQAGIRAAAVRLSGMPMPNRRDENGGCRRRMINP